MSQSLWAQVPSGTKESPSGHPLVRVRFPGQQETGWAELMEIHPDRPVVRVIYTASRTSAWVARNRVVEL